MKNIKAVYVSVWESQGEIQTSCDYNPETKEVTNVEVVDLEDDDDILIDEYIWLSTNEEVRSFDMDGEVWEDGQKIIT